MKNLITFLFLFISLTSFPQSYIHTPEADNSNLDITKYKIVIAIDFKDGSFGPSQTIVNVIYGSIYQGNYIFTIKNFSQLKAKYGSNFDKQTLYIRIGEDVRISKISKVIEDPFKNGEGKIISSTGWMNEKQFKYMFVK